jgi:polysaccharide biosynthesis/export protein
MKKNYFLTFIIISLFTLFSCGSRKEIVYFQTTEELNTNFNQFVPRIQANDQLAIIISGADPNAVAPFNNVSSMTINATQANVSPYHPTYVVNENGDITLPIIGNVKIAGLTRNEAATAIKEKLDKYIVNPSVLVNFVNFRITVLGEVAKPGSFILPNERVTLLDALGLAGDLTIKGKRENVIVIREANGKKEKYILDLTSDSTLNSPAYYLAQNDVVYVEPNSAQVAASKFTPNYSLWISMAGVVISVIAVLTR